MSGEEGGGDDADGFDEDLCVHLLSDLAEELQRPLSDDGEWGYGFGEEGAKAAQATVLRQIKVCRQVGEVEVAVASGVSGCFLLLGVALLVVAVSV
jgi:hypothetical protein